jgi:hypothetical protein
MITLAPQVIKIVVGIGIIVAAFISGYVVKGNADKVQLQIFDLAVKDLTIKLGNELSNVRVEYVTKTKVIYKTGKDIADATPNWVNPTIFVNRGFIDHHNSAAMNQDLPTVPQDVMVMSTVTLAEAEEVIAGNYAIAAACRQQVESLQDAIRVYQSKTKVEPK